MITLALLGLFVVTLALLAAIVQIAEWVRCRKDIGIGDKVVYRMQKTSNLPGKRAYKITPSEHGEGYTYFVDKFWVVASSENETQVRVKTRTNKQRTLPARDPNLRKPTLLEILFYKEKFPEIA